MCSFHCFRSSLVVHVACFSSSVQLFTSHHNRVEFWQRKGEEEAID